MNKNTKKMLIIGGIGVAGVAFWYFFFGPGATPAAASTTTNTTEENTYLPPATTATTATPTTTNGYSPADMANIAVIEAWINSMPAGSAQQNHWLSVIQSNPSSAVLELWVQCMHVFGTPGASLSASQQAFWNNLAAGY